MKPTGKEIAARYFDGQVWLASYDDMAWISRIGLRVTENMYDFARALGVFA